MHPMHPMPFHVKAGEPPAPSHRATRAFTLVEVLVAMAIFAIGFAMVAGIIPAGHILNKRTEDDVLAIVAAKNVVAVIEAKKIYVPAWEHTYMHDLISEGSYRAPGNNADDVAAAAGGEAKNLGGSFMATTYDNRPNDGDTLFDFEDRLTNYSSWAGYKDNPYANYCRGWQKASASFRFWSDTNNDGTTGNGYDAYTYADCTDMPLGRIHAYHHRVGYSDIFPSEDITYPSYVSSLPSRDYLSCVVVTDLNADTQNRRWVAAVAVMRRHEGDTWPERADGANGTSKSRLVVPNNPAGLRSADTGQGHPNSGWNTGWGYWNTFSVSGNDTDPSIPGLYNLPAIVYDYSRDLIEVAYPPCWTPGAYAPVAASIDRRMAAGDKFIAREGGTIFTVLSTSDLGADKRYQVLKVYPPLRTTLLGPNADPYWRLREVYFSPRPAGGGASPLVRIETISADRGFTTNTNH